jgi:protein-tyrosine phosphatase
MNDFSSTNKGLDVPDPWYGGASGFETVLDMIEDSCKGLLDRIKKEYEI